MPRGIYVIDSKGSNTIVDSIKVLEIVSILGVFTKIRLRFY